MPNRSASAAAFDRARKVIPGGVNSPARAFGAVGGTPLFIARGEGPYLFDIDGNRYLDFIGSWGPMILGHCHPSGGGSDDPRAQERLELRRAVRTRNRTRGAGGRGRSVGGDGAVRLQRHRGDDERDPPRARVHRPRPHRQVRRVLSRPRRFAARLRRVQRADARRPQQPRRSQGLHRRHARAAASTTWQSLADVFRAQGRARSRA